jgi:DNA-binding IclR family transcriptional regulator
MKQLNSVPTPLVPALERGIRLVRELDSSGTASLQALAAHCRIPKPSAMRLLHTLTALGIAQHDSAARTYHLAMHLVPLADPGSDLNARVGQALERLSHATGDTAEWYVPAEEGMVLSQRREPPGDAVRVVARAGFVRRWQGELDAVACVAHAHGNHRPASTAGFWTYDKSGRRVSLSAAETRRRLAQARVSACAADSHYNPNGVRRFAAAVCRSGALVGALALATGFRPGQRAAGESLRVLKEAVSALST